MFITPLTIVWRLMLLHFPVEVPCHCVQKCEIGRHEKIVTMTNVIATAAVMAPTIPHAARKDLLGKILTRKRRRATLVMANIRI